MGASVIFINGAVGVGKTTTLDAVGDLLKAKGVAHGLLDLDWLRRAWPPAPGDPFSLQLELANLKVLAGNHWAFGARVLVLAGVVETDAQRSTYEDVLGCSLTIVRLVGARGLIRQRLRERYTLNPDGLEWHLKRLDELTKSLDKANLDDATVETSGEVPLAVARGVLDIAGL